MLATLIAVALFQQPSAIQPGDLGSALYQSCQSAIRVQDGTANADDLYAAPRCSSYTDGFIDGFEAARGRNFA